MKRIASAIAALGLLATGSAANAADAPRGAAMYNTVSATSWAGWYAGLHAGWGWGDSNQRQGPGQTNDYDIDGFVGGAQLGYNWQRGQWVYGIETDFSFADIDGTGPSSVSYGCGGALVNGCQTEVDWFGTTRARIGIASGSWLFYGTGGLAYADLFAQIVGGPDYNGGETKFGWTIGAGAERMLSSGWSVKVEYLYLDFDRFDFGTSVPQPTAEANFHVVRAGLNYWFR